MSIKNKTIYEDLYISSDDEDFLSFITNSYSGSTITSSNLSVSTISDNTPPKIFKQKIRKKYKK